MITAQQLFDLSQQYDKTCSYSDETSCDGCVFASKEFCADHCPEFAFSTVNQAQKFLDFVGYVEVSPAAELAEILPYEHRSTFKNCTFTDIKVFAG